MLTSPDFRELLKLSDGHDVPYLIVGGYAVMRYTGAGSRRISPSSSR